MTLFSVDHNALRCTEIVDNTKPCDECYSLPPPLPYHGGRIICHVPQQLSPLLAFRKHLSRNNFYYLKERIKLSASIVFILQCNL